MQIPPGINGFVLSKMVLNVQHLRYLIYKSYFLYKHIINNVCLLIIKSDISYSTFYLQVLMSIDENKVKYKYRTLPFLWHCIGVFVNILFIAFIPHRKSNFIPDPFLKPYIVRRKMRLFFVKGFKIYIFGSYLSWRMQLMIIKS